MRVRFFHRSDEGWAEYDESSGEYSWEYEGDDERIQGLLSDLDDGRVYETVGEGGEVEGEDGTSIPIDHFVFKPWPEQIEELADSLEFYGANVVYLGD